jgi:hypothetical protein
VRSTSSTKDHGYCRSGAHTHTHTRLRTPHRQILLFLRRLLVRAKVFQLVGCSGIALAVAAVMASPESGSSDAAAALALAACCAAASYSLWYYSRRYVGELALLEGGKVVRLSVLDFWGNREVGGGAVGGVPLH